MLIKTLSLIFISIILNAKILLQDTYFVANDDINLSSIVKDVKQDVLLFQIQTNRYSKKIKSRLLINILKQNGYENFDAKKSYITFIKKSHIDTSKIKESIKKYYEQNYSAIDIKNIEVYPRGYIDLLPKDFTVHLRKRNFLSNYGVVSIKTPKNKQTFFDYTVFAKLPVYLTKEKLEKNTQLSEFNTIKKSIILEKFRAKPIQKIAKNTLQVKHRIMQNKILTTRDVEELVLIKRGSDVSITLDDGGVEISFEAKAIKNARMGEITTVRTNNNKVFKVKAIGKNKAEMW